MLPLGCYDCGRVTTLGLFTWVPGIAVMSMCIKQTLLQMGERSPYYQVENVSGFCSVVFVCLFSLVMKRCHSCLLK